MQRFNCAGSLICPNKNQIKDLIRNIGNHLKSMPVVYIILINKPNSFCQKLFRQNFTGPAEFQSLSDLLTTIGWKDFAMSEIIDA